MALIKRLSWAVSYPLFRSPLHIQLHIAINTMNPLMIEAIAIEPDPIKALPKAPTRTLLDDPVQHVDNRFITLQPVFPWPI